MQLEHPRFPETADIETSSDDYARRFAGEIGQYFLEVQTNLTLNLLRQYQGCRILDVGGGHCQLALPLVNRGFDVTITGSDESCAQRARALLPSGRYSYSTCNSLELPYADREFDVVLSFRLLPHVTQWEALIAELCRVAGKQVIFDYPDIRSSNLLYRLLFHLKKSMEGNTRTYTMFSRAQIRRQFVSHGFAPPVFSPEFFWPMVLHRSLQRPLLAKALEAPPRWLGLTHLFGSPIIAASSRRS